MSIADLGSLGEFVSSFAVLITLIVLTLQMRQNTKAVKASTAAEMTSQWLVNATSGATSRVLHEAFDRVNKGESPMAPAGLPAYFFSIATIKVSEFAFVQWREGNLDEEMWKTHISTMQSQWTAPHFEEMWAAQRNYFTQEFQAYVESLKPPAA